MTLLLENLPNSSWTRRTSPSSAPRRRPSLARTSTAVSPARRRSNPRERSPQPVRHLPSRPSTKNPPRVQGAQRACPRSPRPSWARLPARRAASLARTRPDRLPNPRRRARRLSRPRSSAESSGDSARSSRRLCAALDRHRSLARLPAPPPFLSLFLNLAVIFVNLD